MSEQCQRCSGRSLNAYLCGDCETELKDALTGLVARGADRVVLPSGEVIEGRPVAGWLELLGDSARGETRLGVSVRHSTDLTSPLPFNERASDLLAEATETLTKWVGAINHNNETLGTE